MTKTKKKKQQQAKRIERARNYQERMEQRQVDASIGSAEREVASMPAVQAERDFTAVVFEGDAEAYEAFEEALSLVTVIRLHRTFGGRDGISVIAGILEDICHGDVATFAALLKGLGGERALRHMLVVFNGETTRIASVIHRVGTTGAFTDYFKEQARARAEARRIQDPGTPLPHIAVRVERIASDSRTQLAQKKAQSEQQKLNVQHPVAQDVMKRWYLLEAELEDLESSGKPSTPALLAAIESLSHFIQVAEQARASVEKEWFHWAKYRDSKGKIDALIQAAKQKSTDLAQLLVKRSGPMPFPAQRMIPSAKNLEEVQARMKEEPSLRTPNQAWALISAEHKGAYEKAFFRIKALQRMEEFNTDWGTDYDEDDLDLILRRLVSLPLATNYTFAKKPGDNLDKRAKKVAGTPLKNLLMQSTQFKQVWETGASQASTDLTKRGAVEEQMGYGPALNRTQGKFQDYNDATSKFGPSDITEMPKYAALVSPTQAHGVARRYGESYVIWKDSLHERMTHTPGDSWNQFDQGVKYFTSPKHPEVLFANSDEPIIRLAAAEATGKDAAWLKKQRASGADFGGPYIETQLHGDVGWKDVAAIVIGDDEVDSEAMMEEFRAFARKHGYDFMVRGKAQRQNLPKVGAKLPPKPKPKVGGPPSASARTVTVVTDKPIQKFAFVDKPLGQVPAGNRYFLSGAQNSRLARAGLKNIPIAPDGDCLFASLIRVGAYSGTVQKLRLRVAGLVESGQIDVTGFNLDPVRTATDIRQPGSYNNLAGDATPALIANALGINIIIYNEDGSTTTLDSGGNQTYHVIRFLNPAAHYHATAPN
ncbi:hypothetical protein LZ198_04055 [Myxococcus sp. K15C18031901]|uniref:OTU domain-containing protein n=1 Tax=Myxococcus dinghuensis TaxID=2906761 RepID=UPI0020A78F39|nr:OTU domain-containing protein [Myxococcus dinghuensis]MCP3098048.1 hypothetical protein [Myxococcus dinghuensis]